jgi:hypothetical protein
MLVLLGLGGCVQTRASLPGVERLALVEGPALQVTRVDVTGQAPETRWVLADEETASLRQARVAPGHWFYLRRGLQLPTSYRVEQLESGRVVLTRRDYVHDRAHCHCMRPRSLRITVPVE